MKKVIGIGFILLLITGLLAACGNNTVEENKNDANNKQENNKNNDQNDSDKKVLLMGTSADFPPFESRNPQGEFIGFDIEWAELIADELGYELEIEDMKFGGLVGSL